MRHADFIAANTPQDDNRHLLEASVDGVNYSLCGIEGDDPFGMNWRNMNRCDAPATWYCPGCVDEWVSRVGENVAREYIRL